ncbi:RsmE family RNA methyltransferase [Marinoscillum pacificum]|uniref:RsmE family RNA methyltransferase n=1 Tax=Marinoscillum pacificum TaxID=392723 RepID=UPI0021589C2F|nr:RsmE family RNA methyltransferase [Marinoscillum pacificum]
MIYFYHPDIVKGSFELPEEEHMHCSKVLRKTAGDKVGIYDGIGGDYTIQLTEVSKKVTRFEVVEKKQLPAKKFYNHIAIAPTKNIDRIEWFVEKACELGVDEISLILTKNCERTKIRIDRLEKKAVSALKQSKSGYLTKINDLVKFDLFLKNTSADSKFIAVVENNLPYYSKVIRPHNSILTLIGPEGDFTPEEASKAFTSGFEKISLGSSTLRTETAGLAAGHFVNMINEY